MITVDGKHVLSVYIYSIVHMPYADRTLWELGTKSIFCSSWVTLEFALDVFVWVSFSVYVCVLQSAGDEPGIRSAHLLFN